MSGPSNRVEPRFFGAPELYNSTPKKKEPFWAEESNPPPPYTPNEPASSSTPINASAPPLELSPDYSNYPPNQYGTIPYPPNNTSDAGGTRSWPWVSPSSAPEPPFVYQTNQVPTKKKKTYCEHFVQILFYVFCFCLLFRLIDLLINGVQFAGTSCAHGTPWVDVPKEIEFNAGLKLRVIGGSLSSGKITIKTITSESILENGITLGTVHATALVSPASLIYNPDLSFSVNQFANGTTLEFYLPQNLPSRACVGLNAVIYVPPGTSYISVEVQNTHIIVSDETINVEKLGLETTNQAIDIYSNFKGKELGLSTTNGHIELFKPINIIGTVILASTNGMIRTRDSVFATELIYMITTNGAIDIDKEINCKKATKLITSNGHIYANNITGDLIEVRTSNGRIKIDHSFAITSFDVQSTNAQIDVKLDSGNSVQAMLRTSNGDLSATFPSQFEGSFEIGTNSYNKVSLIDPLGWTELETVTKNQVIGKRYSPIQYYNNEGNIHMGTTNANIRLSFLD